MNRFKTTILLPGVLALLFGGVEGALAQQGDAVGIVKRSQLAFFYPGEDFQARVTMDLVNPEGKVRKRDLSLLRKNASAAGEQKYILYFHNPPDVRGTSFLVWKYPARDDDRWLYIPAIRMVRRIAAKDRRSSFVGSDFTYEDISGRDIESDTHTVLREEKVDRKPCYVIQSVPQEEAEYTKKISWIDKKTFLPLKEEYYDVQGELYRLFTADEVKEVQGFSTVVKRTMKNVKSGHHTEVTFTRVKYQVGVDEGIFSERSLQNPPERWIR